MKLSWDQNGWEDYLYWQKTDKKILKKINELIKDTMRQPFEGLGKPEALKENLTGCWSRRIDQEHRLVYKVLDDAILILQCRYHY
ncbi:MULTISPECIES: Txe/YoeB family addiction module toxin [unclassified Chitinophaga]|uniref:Txe/YoeB family addiction module toxin n=1 Tax=unclassified Chitinophaga TaxID=2619133 RepID=UPI0009C8E221|nr:MULTISPECIES: Txe/YoeB family addiction module toxin [unclassified Chitinophaga]OMP79844.1 toxin YoeB [[Flexibacter] sp. ATCC 35208]WPV68589.1 Txe/YoeB family addiction module toxin [Chitinophaga sp. LS1]